MKLEALIRAIYSDPALITPEAHASIRALIESRLGLETEEIRAPGKGGMCGEKVEVEQIEIKDGVAYIPINGAIGQKLDPFDRGEGAVDVLDLANEIDIAEASDKVHSILFDIDSPGGMVTGTPELAAKISAIQKPAMAFTNGMIASAAYWLASGVRRIFATPTASIGSIGVYLPIMDTTGFYAARGVKVELIKAGKLKGMGYPGTTLTESQREFLQDRVNKIYSMFTTAVKANRGNIASDTMQGQVFLADEAKDRGLIDEIVPNRAAVVRLLSRG
jgi:signal peptide peptidase SppA